MAETILQCCRSLKRDDLIIDVGMHVGEDTEFYLAKGFDVVAIEANPDIAQAATERFSNEIAAGRLTIMPVAIAEMAGPQRLAISDEMTIWSSLSSEFVDRNESFAGTSYRYIDVPAVTFSEVLAKVGIPYYLKIDIEGLDMLCVKALREFAERPTYVSVESNVTANDASADAVFDEVAELWSLGYRSFKYINQRMHPKWNPPRPPLEGQYVDIPMTIDGSGPFGAETPGRWLGPSATMCRAEALRLNHNVGGIGGRWTGTVAGKAHRAIRARVRRPLGWYDLHARLALP